MKVILFMLAMNGHDLVAFHSLEGCQKVKAVLEQVALEELGSGVDAKMSCYEDRGYQYGGKNVFPMPFQY